MSLLTKIKRVLQPQAQAEPSRNRQALGNLRGLIHIGANVGQERQLYHDLDLNVLWIEPIPAIYDTLSKNIASFPKQRALNALITDVDHKNYEFHVASNNGASSSILELKDHQDIWPNVQYTETIPLSSRTLPTLLEEHHIAVTDYDGLILDTQGSELLVLQGAQSLLANIQYIHTEVADFEAYRDCCQLEELNAFMAKHGFQEIERHTFAQHESKGQYYDVTYTRTGD